MSKTISGARQTYLDSGQTTDAYYARIVREDGVIKGMTDHVEDQTLNSVLYKSSSGYTPTATSSNIQLQPGVLDVEGILSVLGIPRADIQAGLYDNAEFYAFVTDYTSPVVDDQKEVRGYWGRCRLEQNRFVATFNTLAKRLEQEVGRTDTLHCDTDLGSSRCGITMEPDAWAATTAYTATEAGDALVGDMIKPTSENGFFYKCTTAGTSDSSEPTWSTTVGGTTNDGTVVWTTIRAYTLTGSVTSLTDNAEFTDTTRTEPNDWWTEGKITWLTGNNANFEMDIKTSTAAGLITLYEPMPLDIATSDTYKIQVGCRKRHEEDCEDKFDNYVNFQGQPFVPTESQALQIGSG